MLRVFGLAHVNYKKKKKNAYFSIKVDFFCFTDLFFKTPILHYILLKYLFFNCISIFTRNNYHLLPSFILAKHKEKIQKLSAK